MVFHFSIHAVLITEIYHCFQLNPHTHRYITIEKVAFIEMVHLPSVSLLWGQTMFRKSLQK